MSTSEFRLTAHFLLAFTFSVGLASAQTDPTAVRIVDQSSVMLTVNAHQAKLSVGEHLDHWTLMQVVQTSTHPLVRYAVLEDFAQPDGRMIFANERGVTLALPKTSEATSGDPAKFYFGHTIGEVMNSPTDLLGEEILAKAGDPEYDEIAAAFPPVRKMNSYDFLGTPTNFDKVGVAYGGRTANFDPAPYFPAIAAIRDRGEVREGLVGGYLPILRFVYPESENSWTEVIAFAPFRTSNGNPHIQPVWYRITRVEDRLLKWTRYVDSYHPFPPRTDYDPQAFYADLWRLNSGWQQLLGQAMRVELPDDRVGNMARFAFVREMMTRVNDFPKYGAVDRDYGGSEHDGFPDTFTVDTTAMVEWGLRDLAGRYIDNYFAKFVRDDGSLLYRGPETGQYGRMLTVVAQYVNHGGDPEVLLRNRGRIDAITNLLLALREKSKRLSHDDPAYGMIAGWSEADASLDPDPPRYMQPYFSNSTEAARGFRDIGRVWQVIGEKRKNRELIARGRKLQRESEELLLDLQNSISRSILKVGGEDVLPAIAGVKEPFHIAVSKDKSDPQFRSYRAYMEMMYSGNLTEDQIKMIVSYRSRHNDILLGMPAAYGFKTGIMAGFLSYGYGYGLVQHDMIREALLTMYSDMAHQYTRGTWTAPETRSIVPEEGAAPYCTPAQLVVALMTKWLLVFEDPQSETLWLGKGTPRAWLRDGKRVSVSRAPTRFGPVDFTIVSNLDKGNIQVRLDLPFNFAAATEVRLRAPNNLALKSVTVNSRSWKKFDSAKETITLPRGMGGHVDIIAKY